AFSSSIYLQSSYDTKYFCSILNCILIHWPHISIVKYPMRPGFRHVWESDVRRPCGGLEVGVRVCVCVGVCVFVRVCVYVCSSVVLGHLPLIHLLMHNDVISDSELIMTVVALSEGRFSH